MEDLGAGSVPASRCRWLRKEVAVSRRMGRVVVILTVIATWLLLVMAAGTDFVGPP
jgi:hypothetical protein